MLTSKNITKTFWQFVLPTTGALLVSGLYQVIDGLFIGNYIGQDGLAAINMIWPLVGLIVGFGLMIGVGIGACASIEQGKGDNANASKYIAQFFWLLVIISIPSAIILGFFDTYLLKFQNATDEVAALSLEYSYIFAFGVIAVLGSIAAPMIVRNLGSPMFATFSVVVGAIANIILDYTFIVKLSWGIRGAAIATVLCEAVSAGLCICYILSKRNKIRPKLADSRFNLKYSLKALKIGLSSMTLYVYVSAMILVYNRLLMKYGGNIYVAAYSILGYITGMYYMLSEGVGSGMQPLVSYFFGARKYKEMNKIIKLAFQVCFVIGVCFFILAVIVPGVVVSAFTKEQVLLDIAVAALRIHLSMVILEGFIVVVTMFFQSIGYAGKAISISLGNFFIKIPIMFLLAYKFGVKGIWYSTPISTFLLSIIVIILYVMERRRIRIIAGSKAYEV